MSGIIMPPPPSGSGGVSVIGSNGEYPGYPYIPTGIVGRLNLMFDNDGAVIEPYVGSDFGMMNYPDGPLFLSSGQLGSGTRRMQDETYYIVISGVPHIIITAYEQTMRVWTVYKVRVADADVTLLYTLSENGTDLSPGNTFATQRTAYFDDSGTLHMVFASRAHNTPISTFNNVSQHITIAEDGTTDKVANAMPPYTVYSTASYTISAVSHLTESLVNNGFGKLGGYGGGIKAYSYETELDNSAKGKLLGVNTSATELMPVNKNYFRFYTKYGRGVTLINLVKREDYRQWLIGVRKYLTGK